MKTKVEMEGYEIEIELENGVISVKAEKDDEVVEEFTIEIEEGQDKEELDSEERDEIQGFDDFAQEDDFEGDVQDEEGQDEGGLEDMEMGGQEEDEMGALESFQSFINKRK
jgi:hypothetical protein